MKIARASGGHSFEMEIVRNPQDPMSWAGATHADLAACMQASFRIDGNPVSREDFELALRISSV